jgi:hypothetical protein
MAFGLLGCWIVGTSIRATQGLYRIRSEVGAATSEAGRVYPASVLNRECSSSGLNSFKVGFWFVGFLDYWIVGLTIHMGAGARLQ